MRDFSIAHAYMGVSYAVQSSPNEAPQVIKLETPDQKDDFLFQTLAPGDRLFMELGGPGQKIMFVAMSRGIQIHCIPTFKVGSGRRREGEEHSKVEQTVLDAGWNLTDEPSRGGETSRELTARKARALAIMLLSEQSPDAFLLQGEPERQVMMIRHIYRSFATSKKALIAMYQRLVGSLFDNYLLELAKNPQPEVMTKLRGKYDSAVVRQAMNTLLVYVPEDQRETFLAKLGLDKMLARKYVPRAKVKSMFKTILEAMLEKDVSSPFLKDMANKERELGKLLKANKIFRLVFANIPGCGPLISARIISAIVDMRRFEDVPALKAFAGYHHFEDGSRARRVAGKVSNWNTELKQAVYLWTEQTLKMPGSPWRARLDQRRAYELYQLLAKRQLKAQEAGHDFEIMPESMRGKKADSVDDFTVKDLAVLSAHVDVMRKRAGIKSLEAEEADDEDVAPEEEAPVADAD